MIPSRKYSSHTHMCNISITIIKVSHIQKITGITKSKDTMTRGNKYIETKIMVFSIKFHSLYVFIFFVAFPTHYCHCCETFNSE